MRKAIVNFKGIPAGIVEENETTTFFIENKENIIHIDEKKLIIQDF